MKGGLIRERAYKRWPYLIGGLLERGNRGRGLSEGENIVKRGI